MFDVLLNQDQTAVLEGVRDYLAREGPLRRERDRKAAAFDGGRARAGMTELGWLGVGLPEAVGGAGLGLVEELIVQRECGRELVSPSVLASVLAAHAAGHQGDNELAAGVLAGRTKVAFALPSPGGAPAYAFDWTPGDLLLVCDAGGVGLFAADAFAEARPEPCLDDSVTMHAGVLDQTRPRCWIAAEDASLAQRAQVLLAAALVGLAERTCELAVDYAKVREQFGRPIGAFQAIKHRCADMGVRARLAWSQTGAAGLKLQAAQVAELDAAAAKLVAARAAHENARNAVQVHGAIGFQAECDVHWFVKRAHVLDQLGGGARSQALRIAALPSPLW